MRLSSYCSSPSVVMFKQEGAALSHKGHGSELELYNLGKGQRAVDMSITCSLPCLANAATARQGLRIFKHILCCISYVKIAVHGMSAWLVFSCAMTLVSPYQCPHHQFLSPPTVPRALAQGTWR